MNKKNFFEGGGIYVAPEIEMIPVIVEAGICLSGDYGFEETPEGDGVEM